MTLPAPLQHFIENGKSTFHCHDGDWDVKVEPEGWSSWKDVIPADSRIIGNNGCGDYLFLRQSVSDPRRFSQTVYVFWHEEQCFEVFADDIAELTDPPPPESSQCRTIFYYDGMVDVQLGDEVSARRLFSRKKGKIVYLPGVSPKKRDMEYGGLCWVGIEFHDGTLIESIVDPHSYQLKKSIRFIGRSSA